MPDFIPNKSDFSAFPKQEVVDQKDAEDQREKQHQDTLKAILKRFDERIAFYERIDSIPRETIRSKKELLHVFDVNTLVVENLRQERTILQGFIDQ